MHLQKTTEMLSGLSSLTAGGVEGSSTVNLGHSGLDNTMFRGRDIYGCVGCESQVVPEVLLISDKKLINKVLARKNTPQNTIRRFS